VPKRNPVVARIDASSDAIIAEGKLHPASGAPSDAEVRREIAAARRAGIALPSGNSVEAFTALCVLEVVGPQPGQGRLEAGWIVDTRFPAEDLSCFAIAEVLVLAQHLDGLARE
jgi:hypothetical protein